MAIARVFEVKAERMFGRVRTVVGRPVEGAEGTVGTVLLGDAVEDFVAGGGEGSEGGGEEEGVCHFEEIRGGGIDGAGFGILGLAGCQFELRWRGWIWGRYLGGWVVGMRVREGDKEEEG